MLPLLSFKNTEQQKNKKKKKQKQMYDEKIGKRDRKCQSKWV